MKCSGRFFLRLLSTTICFLSTSEAQTLKRVKLPSPQTDGGRPLMQVPKERKSTRDFGPGTLSPQMLSNLLWAAFGIHRPDGRRTAPSAMNWQEVDIYVAAPDGIYVYDAKGNALTPVLAGDFRSASEGLATVVRASIDKTALARTLNLRADQIVVLAQSVGYPKN
jgi:Nitroreductase family